MAQSPDDETFKERIGALTDAPSSQALYPRPDLGIVRRFLGSRPRPTKEPLVASRLNTNSDIVDDFIILHDISTKEAEHFAASAAGITQYKLSRKIPGPSILFMRGYASPEWLRAVGDKHGISPELCRRHLEFEAFQNTIREYHASPTLPSSSVRAFQLHIPTIRFEGRSDRSFQPEDLQGWRQQNTSAMTNYSHHLRNRAEPADSLVRDCFVFSKQELVLEQAVTIEVGQSSDDWRAIVWLDNGRDLYRGEPGPWSPSQGSLAWETHFLPVIVDVMAESPSLTHGKHGPPQSSLAQNDPKSSMDRAQPWEAAQNACLLPILYGSQLDSELMKCDAVYALSEIFQFAASAQLQFINLLQERVEHELSFVGKAGFGRFEPVSLLNLKYIKSHLTKASQRISEVVNILKNRQSLGWPHLADSERTARTADLLLIDFEHLQQRAETLARECEQGMVTLTNSSVLEESRRSTERAKRVQRLTAVATLFIPLSFVCSFWGMNFREFGSGS